MQKARADAIKEVYDHYKPGGLLMSEQFKKNNGEKYEIDPKLEAEAAEGIDWLVGLQRDAANVLVERINAQAEKLDFSKPNLTEQKGYREFALLSDTAFDQSQDMIASSERMDEKFGKGTYWEATGKVGACSQPSREFTRALLSQRNLVNGLSGKNESCIMGNLSNMFRAQAIQQQIGKTLKENTDMKYADADTDDVNLAAYDATRNAQYDDDVMTENKELGTELPGIMVQSLGLAQEYIRNPQQFCGQIQNGVMEGRMKLKKLSLPGVDKASSPGAGKASPFEVRDAGTVELEQQHSAEDGGASMEH